MKQAYRIKKQKLLLSLGILLILASIGILFMYMTAPKEYDYTLRRGAPSEYDMLYGEGDNYLFDKGGKPLFTFWGGRVGMTWGRGKQASSILEGERPLPYGIRVRWFSVTEDQFWEGEHLFDQELLQKLSQYEVNSILYRERVPFMRRFSLIVYVLPGGGVTVWVSGMGDRFVLAQFQAQKTEEVDWADFSKALHYTTRTISRAEFVQEVFDQTPAHIQQEIKEGKLPLDWAPWKRRMKRYSWKLVGNADFMVKDYWSWYVNGEQYYTYVDKPSPFYEQDAVPYFISFYVQSTTGEKQLQRISLTLDEEEMMASFERFAKEAPATEPLQLQLDIEPDLKKMTVYLVQGELKHKLRVVSAELDDLYIR